MIELKDVSCSFSDRLAHKGRFTAVSSITANFENGGRYAIVGESGSGKTTLWTALWFMAGQGQEKSISKKCRSSNRTPLQPWTQNSR